MKSDASGIPELSVVIAVRNDPEHLQACLEAIRASTFQRYEIIVVDDASTDDTCGVARILSDTVLPLEKQVGPAAARNQGVQMASGQYVLFVDADVCVHSDTLGRVVETFENDSTVDALFGSYDRMPAKSNILSQYKNLFHHYVHQNSCEEASTFWTGCGAIKRGVFLQAGGFDTGYKRPCIEDIELGSRLTRAGYSIVLKKEILATHLKKWTLCGMIKSDIFDRGVPWTELMLKEGAIPNDLNLRFSQRFCTLLSIAFVALLFLAIWQWHSIVMLPISGFLGLMMLDCWSLNHSVPVAVKIISLLLGLFVLGLACAQFKLLAVFGLLCLLGIVVINRKFYWFFVRERNVLFAATVLPLHLLYYLYSGLAFAIGSWRHLWKNRVLRMFSDKPSIETT